MVQESRPLRTGPGATPPASVGAGVGSEQPGSAFLFCPRCSQTLCQELADGRCPMCKGRIGRARRKARCDQGEPKTIYTQLALTRTNKMKTSEERENHESVTGTKEWACRNCNCCKGCSHDCIYCYARFIAVRYKRLTPQQWPDEVVQEHMVQKTYRQVDGTTMFPTTHDITPGNLQACETVLKKLLGSGSRVLIVSKPHLACIQRLCAELVNWKAQVLFRFTIGLMDEDLRQFWEPGAPAFSERLASLRWAREAGYETSVSVEPLLEPWNVRSLIDAVHPFVSHSIWIGKANQLRQRTAWKLPPDHPEIIRLLSWQTDEKVREIYDLLKGDPLIRWKDSYKKVIGIERPREAGLDV